jgi:hypothetical protein
VLPGPPSHRARSLVIAARTAEIDRPTETVGCGRQATAGLRERVLIVPRKNTSAFPRNGSHGEKGIAATGRVSGTAWATVSQRHPEPATRDGAGPAHLESAWSFNRPPGPRPMGPASRAGRPFARHGLSPSGSPTERRGVGSGEARIDSFPCHLGGDLRHLQCTAPPLTNTLHGSGANPATSTWDRAGPGLS